MENKQTKRNENKQEGRWISPDYTTFAEFIRRKKQKHNFNFETETTVGDERLFFQSS